MNILELEGDVLEADRHVCHPKFSKTGEIMRGENK
jgi:hypothetical protein